MGLVADVSSSHRDVKLRFAYDFLTYLSQGIWSVAILSTYLTALADDKVEFVGYVEGAQGVCMALVSLPCGWFTDKYGHKWVLRAARLVGCAAALLGMYGVWEGGQSEFAMVSASLVLWGVYFGLSNPALDAHFANSTPPGARSSLFTFKAMCVFFAAGLGPAVNVVLFETAVPDTWTLPELRKVMLLGLGLNLLPVCGTVLFSVDSLSAQTTSAQPGLSCARSSSAGSAGSAGSTGNAGSTGSSVYEDARSPALSPLTSSEHSDEVKSEGDLSETEDLEEEDGTGAKRPLLPGGGHWVSGSNGVHGRGGAASRGERCVHDCCCVCPLETRWVPRVILAGDLVISVASGMTIKFFPLFFQKETSLTPLQTNLIYVVNPFLLCVFSWVAQKLSRIMGRMEVSVVWDVLGVMLLFLMAFEREWWAQPALIVPIFILRTVLMNSTSQLVKSVATDYIASGDQAKWAALDSIARFGWSGSAVLGGILVGRTGYGQTFVITASLQAAATVMYAVVIPTVPRREAAVCVERSGGRAARSGTEKL